MHRNFYWYTKLNEKNIISLRFRWGGHKSTAYAIKESLEVIYGDKVKVDTVDVLSKEYGPIITSTAPAIYKTLIKSPKTWELFIS